MQFELKPSLEGYKKNKSPTFIGIYLKRPII